MIPYFNIFSLTFHTSTFLMILSILISIEICRRNLNNKISLKYLLFFSVSLVFTSMMGARIFHLLFERADISTHQIIDNMFQFEGMTFYGSLFTGLLYTYLFLKFVVKNHELRGKIWDNLAICCSMTYGVMRLGCFANGCCWGSISGVPWSIQYFNELSFMPNLGIPVHPVQLYDSILGFSIMGIILYLYLKEKMRGQLINLFLFLYSAGRYFTENFRGDLFRGDKIFWDLSTSQVISIIIFNIILVYFLDHLKDENYNIPT